MDPQTDFDALAEQALTAPPARNVVAFPAAQRATEPDYEGLAGAVVGMQTSVAKQNLLAAQGSNPDRAAQALAVTKQLGIPQPAAEENLDHAQASAQLQTNMAAVDANPGLAAFLASNPLAARIAHDDFQKLSTVEQFTTALKTGVSAGVLGNQLGRMGNALQAQNLLGLDTTATRAEIGGMQARLEAAPKLTGGLGVVHMLVSGGVALIDNFIEGGAVGAAAGAGVGALVGTAGAVPGAAAGFTIGGFVDMATTMAGSQYLALDRVRGADGQPLTEPAKQIAATVTGVLSYAMLKFGFGGQAEGAVAKLVAQATTRPAFSTAAAKFALGFPKGAATGGAFMGLQEVVNIAGEEAAKVMSEGTFESNPHQMVERVVDATVNGLIFGGAMHAAMGGLGLYGDLRAARRADEQATLFKSLLDGSVDTKLHARDLDAFQAFLQHQTDGTPVENLFIPAAKIRELYQGARLNPDVLTDRAADPLFGWVKDMPEQLRQAAATGGDVVIPTADFVAHAAGTPLAEGLLRDIRVGADAMSVNEAKAFGEEYQRRIKTATETAAEDVTPAQKIADDIRAQATAAGRPASEAAQVGALMAARYATRAERRGLGEDPFALYQAEGPKIAADGAITDASGRVMQQAAYHGTHKRGIDKFSTDYIGTGEGAQAYGWGLYFAGRKEIAEHYRKAVSKGRLGDVALDGKPIEPDTFKAYGPEETAAFYLADSKGDIADAKRRLIERGHESARDWLDANKDRIEYKPKKGQLYEAEIPDDAHMLLWDKPLSEQPQAVLDALKGTSVGALAKQGYPSDNGLRSLTLGEAYQAAGRSQKATSEELAAAGIKGIKYLDNTSRTAGEGTHNYVVFSGDDVAIKKTFYQSAPKTEAFRKWFGDSKVVDDKGEPLVVYHGTNQPLDAFDTERRGASTGALSAKEGFWFTDHPGVAGEYADKAARIVVADAKAHEARSTKFMRDVAAAERKGDWDKAEKLTAEWEAHDLGAIRAPDSGQNVVPVYLSMKNPLVVDVKGATQTTGEGAAIIARAKTEGYDGVVFKNTGDVASGTVSDHYVAFKPEQIKSAIGNTGEFDPNNPSILHQPKRGSISFTDAGAVVRLFRDADSSTLVHEASHSWLEELAADAARPDAPKSLLDDLATARKFLGNDGSTFTDAQHELFARTGEAYLLEGKAPSASLARVFSRFKAWLSRIYQTVTRLDTPINDDIRGVFDRLLATDAEIADAKTTAGLTPNFKDRAEAGMTQAEWGAYLRTIERANTEAEGAMLDKTMARVRRQRTAEYREERRAMADEVAKDIDARPDVQALTLLRSKDGPRLSTDAVRELYGDEAVANMPKGVLSKEGLLPDVAAATLGTNADALVAALHGLEKQRREAVAAGGARGGIRQHLIDLATDARMAERKDEILDPASIKDEAMAAVHSEGRAEQLALELRYLRRMGAQALVKQGKERQAVGAPEPKEGPAALKTAQWNEQADANMAAALRESVAVTKPMLDAIRAHVDGILARKTIGDIGNFDRYLRDERAAARQVQQALLKKDWAAAAAAKQRQMLSNILYTRTRAAAGEVDRAVSHLAKLEDSKAIDPEYRAQIAAMLERFDLRKSVSGTEIRRRESLKAFLERAEGEGLVPVIPEALIEEANRTHYKQMALSDFRELADSVQAIAHLGKLKNRLLTSRAAKSFAEARDQLVASIEQHAEGREASTRTAATGLERATAFARRFGAAHVKVATLARVLDGGLDGGPVWEYLVRTANERGDMETTMRAQTTRSLVEILAPAMRGMTKKRMYADIGRALTKEQVFGIALNLGNAGNIQRLLGGEGWTMAQVRSVVQSTLTATDLKVVQAVWDHLETYRPMIGAKEMRVYGVEPKWVEAQPLEMSTADGQTVALRGGYFPIKFDPMASARAEQHADAESAKRQLQGAYTSATTRRGFTKERVEEVKDRPLLYSLQGLYSGVNDVIHDLSWHEWLIDANKIVRNEKIDRTIRGAYGPEVVRQFKTWINDVAEGEKGLQAELDGALGKVRHGVSIAGLGFNVVNAMMQPLGITQSINRVGIKWFGKGIAEYIAHPIELTRRVNEDSAFMANRSRTRFRELNELRNQVEGQTKARELLGTYGYWLMMRFQQAVDVPTWAGAFERATAEGNAKPRAVALADQAVIDSQGSGQLKDLSAIERGGPAQKLFTVFYSFMNTALNLGVGKAMSANTPAKKAKLAVDFLTLYTIPAVLGMSLKAAITPGESGLDDEEKLVKKLIAAQLDYLMGLMVVAREFSAAAKAISGAEDRTRDYGGPAGVRLISDATQLAKQVGQVWDGAEFDDAFRKALVNATGSFFGLPSVQINRSITGTQALMEGNTENPAAVLFGYQEPR